MGIQLFIKKKIRKRIQNNFDKIGLSNIVFKIGVSIKKIKTFLLRVSRSK